jgi:predicted nuclease of predicted toxin-antitoxin system
VKFLVDNQLPTALARSLAARGIECEHVLDVGLAQATDTAIWLYAEQRRLVVISKDEDFLHLAERSGSVQLVWVRLGNCRKAELLAAVEKVWPRVVERLEVGDRVVEIR